MIRIFRVMQAVGSEMMKKRYSIGILALPMIATLFILYVTLGVPLLSCLSEHSTNIGEYFEAIAFLHVTVSIFGILGYVWTPVVLLGFGIGAWLLIVDKDRKTRIAVLCIAIVLAMLPVVFVCLVPSFQSIMAHKQEGDATLPNIGKKRRQKIRLPIT